MMASELCLAVISGQYSCHLFLSYSTISFEDLSTLFFCFLGNFFSLAGLRNSFIFFSETPVEPMSPVICCCFSIKITFLLGAAFTRRAVWCVELSHAAHRKIFFFFAAFSLMHSVELLHDWFICLQAHLV